jgi:hypothetical protein
VILRDDEPSPSHKAAENIAAVRATPGHFKDHEARWKHDVKGYSHRAANERHCEADSTVGVWGDEADSSGRASTTFASVEPRLCTRPRAPRHPLLRAAQHGTCFRTSPA